MPAERPWRELEASIPLERLPDFHRAFLRLQGISDPEGMPLRRVQQAVERELNKLVAAGQARRDGDDILVLETVFQALKLEDYVK